ncbi:TPA: hypothetical protein ACXNPR_002875 [Enterobacter cancerogenus]
MIFYDGVFILMLRNVKLNVLIIISIIIFLVLACCYVVNTDDVTKDQKVTIVVYMVTAAAAIVSAYFVVVGYLINVVVFEASQTPAIRVLVTNGSVTNELGFREHFTIISYANLTNNMCEHLKVMAALKLSEGAEIVLPDLFSEYITLGPMDSRERNFPTMRFLNERIHNNSQSIDLTNSVLTVSYKFPFANRIINYSCSYDWIDSNGWTLKTH